MGRGQGEGGAESQVPRGGGRGYARGERHGPIETASEGLIHSQKRFIRYVDYVAISTRLHVLITHQLSSDQYPLGSSLGFSNHHSCPLGVGGSSSSVATIATSPAIFLITAVVGESGLP